MLKDIYVEFILRASSTDEVNFYEFSKSKREYYCLNTRRLKETLPTTHNENIEYYGSLVYKDLIVVSGYFYNSDLLGLHNKKSYVVFRNEEILGLIETTWTSKDDFYLNVFMDSIEEHELTLAIEITLPKQLGNNLFKSRDKIIEEIIGSPPPSLIKMYPNTQIPFYIKAK